MVQANIVKHIFSIGLQSSCECKTSAITSPGSGAAPSAGPVSAVAVTAEAGGGTPEAPLVLFAEATFWVVEVRFFFFFFF
ncbi:hypothetical protein [Agrobacterium sp.]|uniref:hypothetical protein n=1 Tax=Agrobacterium sp. TaxID=361 RepID=UPI004034D798